ncbi:MAG: PEP-CTERM sorting domain-containing protein [Rhodocyclaceae bacterium]|nr:PEP-CTERM sorting domain-containing protein [Zoogloeaceae bacterium]MCP5254989.1 PEP-CTERM sorting domain-containing protein [Zoogloeaceae bacterium]MCP5295446.1 PEP-CTERM sorting domain-containing protein [Zoogloeaceae bacterium]
MSRKTNVKLSAKRLPRAMIQCGLMAGFLAFGSAAQAAISFTFDYGTDTGTGFWDPVDGATRRAAMDTASTAFADMFASHFSNSATIVLEATATNLPLSTNLASAGSNAFGGNGVGFTVNEIVKTKALGGVDPNGSNVDGSVNVNFGQPWHFDLGSTAPGGDPEDGGKYDFYSTIFHEFTHALGFSSSIDQDGSPFFGGTKAAGEWVTFDQFLVDKDGNRVVNADGSLNQAVWDAASVGGASPANGMFFNGSFAMAANGGLPVGLYTPTSWEGGSSVSHTDDQNPAIYGTMMTAQGPTGPWPRDYSAIEVAMLRDLGYTAVAAVPEPETYAMMLAGLGLLGWAARRRKA